MSRSTRVLTRVAFSAVASCLIWLGSAAAAGAAGVALGPEDAQLNLDFSYAATGRTANQLLTLGF